MAGPIYFAIGDIHGEARKLAALHGMILERIASERRAAKIIHLGDYVDRGPDSRDVIEQIMGLQRTFDRDPAVEVLALMGNHEQLMLDDFAKGAGQVSLTWAKAGAKETLLSYFREASIDDAGWRRHIPEAHITWMSRLPNLIHAEDRGLAFVHAGIDPGAFPDCRDDVRLWTRSKMFMETSRWPNREAIEGLTVVHGHTPVSFEPELLDRRINVDTAACYGGPLTAVVLKDGEAPEFLKAA